MSESLTALVRRLGLRLKPGLKSEEILDVTAAWPGRTPAEIRELLELASGFHGTGLEVDFTGRGNRFYFKELVPHGIALATTRSGDFWVADLYDDGSWHQVFFVSHDPAVLVIQFASLRDFIEEITKPGNAEERGELLASTLCKKGEAGRLAGALTTSPDVELGTFARGLPVNYEIFDLRKAPLPSGFV